MRAICGSRLNQRGTAFILFTLMLLTVIMPLAGLAIDLTIMYVVQAKLWEAVDGAALEGGRLIGTAGTTDLTGLVSQICSVNFPPGYWGSSNQSCPSNTDIITPPQAPTYAYYVKVLGNVTAPTIFMKIFQVPGVLVSASAVVTRRQARIEVVIDRSGSMSGVIGTLKTQVQGFVARFTEGYDEMGLVVFGQSGMVSYPLQNAGPYDFNPAHHVTGGPDIYFNAFSNGCGTNGASVSTCDMQYAIGVVTSNGFTNMSDAISLAYIELQKAYQRDLATDPGGIDIRNNIIILFTDGVPNAMTAYLNAPDLKGTAMSAAVAAVYPVPGVLSPGNSLLGTNTPYASPTPFNTWVKTHEDKSHSPCFYNPSNVYNVTTNPNGPTLAQISANQILGTFSDTSDNNSDSIAISQMATLDTTNYASGSQSTAWSMRATAKDESSVGNAGPNNITPSTNCNGLGWDEIPATGSTSHSASSEQVLIVNKNGASAYGNTYTDIASIPPWDVYGNLTTDLGQGHAVSSASSFPAGTGFTGTINQAGGTTNDGTDAGNGGQMQMAAWNAVDQGSNRIRSDTTMNITFYTIGYSGDGGTDDVLLARVANDPTQVSYGCKCSTLFQTTGNTQRQGEYFPASDTNGIGDAFNKIAGILLAIYR
jgi:Putative Flp pilus-assembly TadE/G-like